MSNTSCFNHIKACLMCLITLGWETRNHIRTEYDIWTAAARLVVRRHDMPSSLRSLAHAPALALLRGKLAIKMVGEEAQDAGGGA